MYQHILIPTDGSEFAQRGVTHGLALAKSLGAKVSVIVVQEPFDWPVYLEMTAQEPAEFAKYSEQLEERCKRVLDRAAHEAKQAGVSCETIQVVNRRPFEAIVAAAKDKGCDLIVMSSHGRSGLSVLLIGSVTNKVLTHAKTPVLVCQ